MPIFLSMMSLESSSATAIPLKASPCSHSHCPSPSPKLFVTHRHGEGRSSVAAPKNLRSLKTQSRETLRPLRLSSSHNNPPADGTSDLESAAKQALSEYLQGELGLSEETAINIASGAPKYLVTLIEGVKELDELPDLWGEFGYQKGDDSVAVADGGGGGGGFKEKVIYMAKQKGYGGRVAFLESLGLTLPSATYIARLLSSETLHGLIHKVILLRLPRLLLDLENLWLIHLVNEGWDKFAAIKF